MRGYQPALSLQYLEELHTLTFGAEPFRHQLAWKEEIGITHYYNIFFLHFIHIPSDGKYPLIYWPVACTQWSLRKPGKHQGTGVGTNGLVQQSHHVWVFIWLPADKVFYLTLSSSPPPWCLDHLDQPNFIVIVFHKQQWGAVPRYPAVPLLSLALYDIPELINKKMINTKITDWVGLGI